MALPLEECVDNKKNIGKSKCDKLPKIAACMITTEENFKLLPADLETTAALKAALQAAMVAPKGQRIYLYPMFTNYENLSEETVYAQTMLGVRKAYDGRYIFRYSISKSLCTHKAIATHGALGGRVMIYDMARQLLGTKDSDGNYRGLSIDLINPEKFRFSDGSTSGDSPVYLSLKDNLELDHDGLLLSVGSVINELERLTDVTLELDGAATGASIKVKVYQSCDGTPVSGLLPADFVLTTGAGAAQNILAAPEVDNVYTLTPQTAFVSGSLTLRIPSLLSVKAYEVEAPVAIVI